MTELETRLANALEQLGNQYAADVRSLSGRLDAQTQQLQQLQQLQQQQTSDREKADKSLREHLTMALEHYADEQQASDKKLRQELINALRILHDKFKEVAES